MRLIQATPESLRHDRPISPSLPQTSVQSSPHQCTTPTHKPPPTPRVALPVAPTAVPHNLQGQIHGSHTPTTHQAHGLPLAHIPHRPFDSTCPTSDHVFTQPQDSRSSTLPFLLTFRHNIHSSNIDTTTVPSTTHNLLPTIQTQSLPLSGELPQSETNCMFKDIFSPCLEFAVFI